MALSCPLFRLAVLALSWKSALGYYERYYEQRGNSLQRLQRGPLCKMPDEIAYAVMTNKTSKLNELLHSNETSYRRVGCWGLMGYNTDEFMTSTVYQHDDGRCALVLSGYHTSATGLARAMLSMMWPPKITPLCDNEVYAPFVRVFRHHTSLGNWSKLVELVAGTNSSCEGELTLAASSVGGSVGEILAACANAGQLDELQNKTLPTFQLQTLYTYGSIAATKAPLKNVLRQDGCFKGKRVFFSEDAVSRLGGPVGLKHPRQDAVEIWDTDAPSVKMFGCYTNEAADSDHVDDQDKPAAVRTHVRHPQRRKGIDQSSIDNYENNLKWIHRVGLDDLLTKEPQQDDTSNEPGAAEEQPGRLGLGEGELEDKEEAAEAARFETEMPPKEAADDDESAEEQFYQMDLGVEPASPDTYAAFFTNHGY